MEAERVLGFRSSCPVVLEHRLEEAIDASIEEAAEGNSTAPLNTPVNVHPDNTARVAQPEVAKIAAAANAARATAADHAVAFMMTEAAEANTPAVKSAYKDA